MLHRQENWFLIFLMAFSIFLMVIAPSGISPFPIVHTKKTEGNIMCLEFIKDHVSTKIDSQLCDGVKPNYFIRCVMFASTNRNSIKEPLFLLFISIPRGV
jgi:hypothetical protein